MAWTMENVFSLEYVNEPRRLVAEYRFTVGVIGPVALKLFKDLDSGKFVVEQSHFIKTPEQGDPYGLVEKPFDDEAYALHMTVASLTDYYKTAVKQGHEPSSNWLVPNPGYCC
jgi:hypothetical protein